VVTKEIFEKAQELGEGLRGPVVRTASNLFTGLAYDGFSLAPMTFQKKGTSKRGQGRWDYLVTSGDGVRRSWNYAHFERLFLEFVTEVDWDAIKREVRLAS
jgi:hypothetical protein